MQILVLCSMLLSMSQVENWLGLESGGLKDIVVGATVNFLIAVLIVVVGFWFAKFLTKTFIRILEARKTEESLVTFLGSLLGIVIRVLVIISAITQLGVEMTSFVALLGAAGLAVGMAFSGTLSNFAGGIMILLFKPFKVGDFIQVGDDEGIVKEILIFNTILTTMDNKTIILPNGPVANGTIVNYTMAKKRRITWQIGIAYGDKLPVAKETLLKFVVEEKRILKDPEPFVGLGELGNSAVIIHLKAWVDVDDYWPVFYDINERIYEEFGKVGLNIPFPQMDVHIKNK